MSLSHAGVDLLLHNGRIATLGSDRLELSTVSSLAIRDGKVIAMGDDDELEPLRAGARGVVDLQGRRAIPGLNDSHIHAVRAGASWNHALHWDHVRSVTEALALIHEAAQRRKPGSWIPVIGGWHSRQFRERRPPTSEELNQAAPRHPVYVQELYDRGILNSAGLKACGWHDHSDDPAGGALIRGPGGELTGEIRGIGAFTLPTTLALHITHEEAVDGTESMMSAFARAGLTGVVDGGGMLMKPADYNPIFDVWQSERMAVRFRLFISAWTRGGEVADITQLTEFARPDFGDGMLKFSGVGEMPHMGCHDMEGLDPSFSIDDASYREFVDITRRCVDRGWRISAHSVLDRSLSAILDAWEEVPGVAGRRFSIVHADQASERNLRRIAALGAGVLVQNRLLLKGADYVEAWGAKATAGAPPLGRMRSLGLTVGGGSDATRGNWYSPWASIFWLVTGSSLDGATRRAPEDRLSIFEAIASYTRDAAWFTGEEGHRGRLLPGYDADICVPTDDPFECDEAQLIDLASSLTIVGGRVTHASEDFADVRNVDGRPGER
ncbi:MAG: amidohydrolase [Actinomycetota bacterium]